VRDEAQVATAMDGVELLVNAAGIGSITDAPNTPLEVWNDVLAVNATGTFLCCKHAIPGMASRRQGAIVNVASVAGLVGMRNRAAYCAAKGAIVALTRALAIDHVGEGIRVNAVAPGTIDTPWVERLLDKTGVTMDELRARQPIGRLGTPEEVADAVLFLATAEFVTGTILTIDGGWTAI
jgi:NAD(P)-dependent dehydrogenase (short-subunit alcohol dehydrogenase family)